MSTHEEELNLHKAIAPDYERRHSFKFAKLYHRFWNSQLTVLADARARTVLDFGCGTGVLIGDLVNFFDDVYGLDISSEMLARVETKSSRLKRLIQGRGEELPFENNFFDVVFCRGALHHLQDPDRGLKEIFRVLKPGGEIILSEPNADSLVLRLPRWFAVRYSRHFSASHRAFGSEEIISSLERAGFKAQVLKRFGFLAMPLGGMAELFPGAKFIPAKEFLIKTLIKVDNFLSQVPLVKRQSWDNIIKAKK